MTEKELKKIETELEKRGYRKFTRNLTANETCGWFKTVDKDYVMEFRVWITQLPYTYPVEQYIGCDFYSTALELPTYAEFDTGWEPICDIDAFERMAEEFHKLVRKFVGSNKHDKKCLF